VSAGFAPFALAAALVCAAPVSAQAPPPADPDAAAVGVRKTAGAMADPPGGAARTGALSAADAPAALIAVAQAGADGPGAASASAGDPAYGEYLASACVACHQLSGRDDGIPPIIGWPRERFAQALRGYKTGARGDGVMRMVTTSLGDAEIAALAAYFEALAAE
jgi:cytochrome c